MKKGYQLLVTQKLDNLLKQRYSHQILIAILLWLIERINRDLKDQLKDASLEVVKAQYVGDGYPCLAIHYFNKVNPQDVSPIVEAAVERLLGEKSVLDLVEFIVTSNIAWSDKLSQIMDHD
ncbi:MAG: hypothetical protein JWQ04_2612 [Pedosphaera sp.]|nr:hypothetical protein [Pedosphaera sp.]